jgi:hypothetical protein
MVRGDDAVRHCDATQVGWCFSHPRRTLAPGSLTRPRPRCLECRWAVHASTRAVYKRRDGLSSHATNNPERRRWRLRCRGVSGEAGDASGRGTEQQKHVFQPETPHLNNPQLEAQVQEEVAGLEGTRLGLHKEGTDEHKGGGEHGGPKGPEPTRYAPAVSGSRCACAVGSATRLEPNAATCHATGK